MRLSLALRDLPANKTTKKSTATFTEKIAVGKPAAPLFSYRTAALPTSGRFAKLALPS